MKVYAKNGSGAVLGGFKIPAKGEVEVPNDLSKHQKNVLGSWIETGVIGKVSKQDQAKAEADAKAAAEQKAQAEAAADAKASK